MRVGIDVRSVETRRQGIGNYTLELVRALAALPDAPELLLFGRPGTAWDLLPASADRLEGPRGPRWHLWAAAAAARQTDLFHSPGSLFVPAMARIPTVLTVHDLVPFRLPGEAEPWSTFTHLAFRTAVRRAASIVTPSRHARDDLADFLPEAAKKTTAIPLASRFLPRVAQEPASHASAPAIVSARPDGAPLLPAAAPAPPDAPPTTPAAIPAQAEGAPLLPDATLKLTDATLPEAGFILAVGSLEPRKNLETLLAAHAALAEPAPPLVLVGNRAWKERTLERRIASHPRPVRVIREASDETLAALYARCGVFVFPSRYEGFGLPVIEAMACGAPVIASTAAAIPEAAGGAAIGVDPLDVGELSRAIARVLQEPALRADLIARGLARARTRTWSDVARETLAVYRRSRPSGDPGPLEDSAHRA